MGVKLVLKKLCETPGVSGFEGQIRKLIKELTQNYADEIHVDKLGNLIVWKEGVKEKPIVMLCAHMDEIGLIITGINDDGTLNIGPVGRINSRAIIGKHVVIWTERGPIPGVIGVKPPHLTKKEDRERIPLDIKELYIDIGVDSKEEAEKYVSIGDHVTLNVRARKVLGEKFVGKAIDDRAGVLVLIEVLKNISNVKLESTTAFVFTVQEEVGARGARVASYIINPDIAIAIDVSHASGYPEVSPKEAPAKLGKGPVISLGTPVNIELSKFLIQVAKQHNIPFQVEAEYGRTGTDMDIIQIVRNGALATVISIPQKYMHSGVEMVSLKDIRYSIELLSLFLKSVDSDEQFKPK